MTDTNAPAVRKMTMEQWKRVHPDFKLTKLDGVKGRWVMLLTSSVSGKTLVPVEIVKEV